MIVWQEHGLPMPGIEGPAHPTSQDHFPFDHQVPIGKGAGCDGPFRLCVSMQNAILYQ